MITEALIRRIIEHFASVDFWRSHWDQAAVVIVGSSVRGMTDAFTDVDILVFVPQTAYSDLCEHYRSAIQSGSIRALNAMAFEFGEFPLM